MSWRCKMTSIWERNNFFAYLWQALSSCVVHSVIRVEALIEMTLWFTCGAYQLIRDRKYGHSIMQDLSVEDTTGFGQLVPLCLLALPLMQIAESHARHSSVAKETDQSRLLSGRTRTDILPRSEKALAPVRAAIPGRINVAGSLV